MLDTLRHMPILKATAVASPNIALIKYWGNRDQVLRLPSNPSLSMNMGGLTTTTTVEFDPALTADVVTLGGRTVSGPGHDRVVRLLERVRAKTSEVLKPRGLTSTHASIAVMSFPPAQAWHRRHRALRRWP